MMVGYFSHIVRTPLNTISAGIQLLQREIDRNIPITDVHITLNEILKACDLTKETLNDIILLEQLESNTIELKKDEFHAKPFLKSKFDGYYLEAREKDINYNYQFSQIFSRVREGTATATTAASESISVLIDEHKISQVIRTLLSNAMESAGEKGTVRVKVSLGVSSSSKGGVKPSSSSTSNTRVDRSCPFKSARNSLELLADENVPHEIYDILRIEVYDSGKCFPKVSIR